MNSKIFTRLNKIISGFPTKLRMKIYQNLSGGSIAPGSYIAPNCVIDNPKHLFIESGANINRFCRFMTSDGKEASISIGKDTWIGCNVSFICITHEMGGHEKRAGHPIFQPITIGSGVWIGADVTILPGVKVADGCVIGAGAVVTKSTQPDGLYVGNPSKRIKDLSEESVE